MKNNSLGMKLLLLAVTLGVVAYFGVQGAQYISDPLTSAVAYTYQVEEGLDLSGFVVRREQVLEDSANGLLRLQRAEGERVSVGGVVATVYADQASLDRQNELQALTTQIQQLEYAQEAALGPDASLKLDAQILKSMVDYRSDLTADRLDGAEGHAAELRALVLKRDYTYSETQDLPARISELRARLNELRSQSANSVRRITAPAAGLYSAVVDGYETVLTPAALSEMKPAQLTGVKPAEVSPSALGKLILGDEWYYAAVMDVSQAQALEESRQLTLRFAKSVELDLDVTVDSIGPEENGRAVVVFRGRSYLPQLTLLRQQSAQVVYSTISGIRIPTEALRAQRASLDDQGQRVTEEGLGVYCLVGAEARFKPVEVLHTGDGFLLVRSALSDTGETSARQESLRLRAGDEIIITAGDLFDGKTVQ